MSIFDTTAPTAQNAFSNPQNAANMNGGGWGINPSYLTPSYTASYRPGYSGPNGGGAGPGQPGFFNSASYFVNPFDRRSGGPGAPQSFQPYLEQIHGRPVDAAMWANQHVVVPTFATAIAFSHLGVTAGNAAGGALGRGFARGLVGGANSFIPDAYKISETQGNAFANVMGKLGGGGRAFGKWDVPGLGGMFLPGVAAFGITSAFNSMVADPYIAYRQAGQNLRSNFQNVYMGGGGNPITGRGLSFGTSDRMAQGIMSQGIHNMSYGVREYTQMADYASRTGLMDDASSGQITQRIKEIASQVKMVMRIANDPDMKSAVEMLARLKVSGASGSMASHAMHQMGLSASMAGISTERMMNTAGAQGGFLFQQNGMVPMVGMTMGSANLGYMQNAYRSGLISPALMASMGGVEGAAQSITAGMVNASQTPYMSISNYNRYLGMGGQNGIMSNLAAFGASFSRNPVGVAGDMGLNGPLMASARMKERGLLFGQDQVMDIASNLHLLNRNGRLDAGTAFGLARQSMGDEGARAYVNLMGAMQLPGYGDMALGSADAYKREQWMRKIDQIGGGWGALTPARMKVQKWVNNTMDFLSTPFTAMGNTVGDWVDSASSGLMDLRYGNALNDINVKDLDKVQTIRTGSFIEDENQGGTVYSKGNRGGRVGREVGRGAIGNAYIPGYTEFERWASGYKSTDSNIHKLNAALNGSDTEIRKIAQLATDPNASVTQRYANIAKLETMGALNKGASQERDFMARVNLGPEMNTRIEKTTGRQDVSNMLEKLTGSSGSALEQESILVSREEVAKRWQEAGGIEAGKGTGMQAFGSSDMAALIKKANWGSLSNDPVALEKAVASFTKSSLKNRAWGLGDKAVLEKMKKMGGKDDLANLITAARDVNGSFLDDVPKYASSFSAEDQQDLITISREVGAKKNEIQEAIREGKIDPNVGGMAIVATSFQQAVREFLIGVRENSSNIKSK